MALVPLISVDDLETWLGEVIDDPDRAELIVAGVSGVIRDETGLTWIDDDDHLEEVPDGVRAIALQVAVRVWRNPVNASSQTTGPYMVVYDRTTGLGVTLTEDERRSLGAHTDDLPIGIGTLSTTRGPIETSALTCGPYWPEEIAIPWQ